MARKRTAATQTTTQASPDEPAAVTPTMDEKSSPTVPATTLEFVNPNPQASEAPNRTANGDAASHREAGDEKQYPPEPNPRAWAENNAAGVQFRTRREPYEAELVFKDKPSQPVIDFIKDNGFRWNREAQVWTRPVGYSTQAQDRLIASRTYHKAVDMILKEKGLAPQPEQQPF